MKDYNNFSPENYKANDKLLNGLWGNLIELALFAIFAAIVSFIYYTLWGNPFQGATFNQGIIEILKGVCVGFAFAVIMAGLYVAHEMLHGIIWSRYTDVKISLTMTMSIGRLCYCEKPIMLKNYIFGLLLPTIILGLIPTVIGIVTGMLLITCFGAAILAANSGGHLYILFLLKNTKDTDFIQDMDSKIGFTIYSPKS